jgi:SAM-dependent methyltransferase
MVVERRRSRAWSWHVSSVFYRWTFVRVAHQVDTDLFAHLGERLCDATVLDCGCGPGVVTEKLIDRGAARVYAIDSNASMLRQVRRRLPEEVAGGRVALIHDRVDGPFLRSLGTRLVGDIDVVLFKRSLYAARAETLDTLRSAVEIVRPGGVVVVIHPDWSLLRYAFAPGPRPASHTAYHLFNRLVSRLGELLGLNRYTVYRRNELVRLIQEAAEHHAVELIPSEQQAYNLAAIVKTAA